MDDVAGFRVLRTAGRGARTRVLLGFDAERTVVLKVSEPADARSAVEIEALERGAGDHVVALDDVACDEEATVLVLERLANGTLADLLERRTGLDAGEAVTILAPLAGTIERLHASGVAHGALSLQVVGFRADGSPTLTGFGNAELFAPGAPDVVRETIPGVLADRAASRGLVTLVLGRVAGMRADAARRLAADPPEDLASLADALFALAAPAPVRFEDDTVADGGERVGEVRETDPEEPPVRGLPPWLLALVPEWMRERLAEPVARVQRLWAGWEPRRRRVVLAVAAGGLGLVVALTVVPGETSAVVAEPTSPSTTAPVVEPDLPEDPVEAAMLLLAERERCVRDLSVLCLDAVVQPGSAAQADDVTLLRRIQDGEEVPTTDIVAGDPVLVERLGDSALLELPEGSSPRSILLMRTTEGWRIRGYLDAPAF